MEKIFLLALGGALGTLCRYEVNVWAGHYEAAIPFGTMVVNVLGSFLMGFLVFYFGNHAELSPLLKLFLTTGFLGGFTTFSTYNMELVGLLLEGNVHYAVFYFLGNVVLGVMACYAGVWASSLL